MVSRYSKKSSIVVIYYILVCFITESYVHYSLVNERIRERVFLVHEMFMGILTNVDFVI